MVHKEEMIPTEDLVSGGIYRNRLGKLMVVVKADFLGNLLLIDWHEEWSPSQNWMCQKDFTGVDYYAPVEYIGSITEIMSKLARETHD